MRRAQSQRDPMEEGLDEAAQMAEVTKLQRKIRVMEGDRRAYAEESCNILRKQESEIENLLKENREIRTVLKLAKSDKNENIDIQDTAKLMDLIDSLDMYKSQADVEEARMKELDHEIKDLEIHLASYKKEKGGLTEVMSEKAIQKTIRVMENRLDKATVRFNQQLSINTRLRQEIDHLRQDRAVFDSLYKKLTRELDDTKRAMNEVITEATQAYEERDEAQNKMLALKERSEKDIAQQEIEMKELHRIIDHDNRLKEFMMFKSCDRVEFKDEEEAKKKKSHGGDKDTDAEKQQIKSYDEAFQRIKEATGEDDINVIVTNFMRKEDANFALFNYVNELNDEVEYLQEEIHNMNKEIEMFEQEDIKNEGERIQMLKDLEEKGERACREREQAERKNVEINKVLDELRDGVGQLFKSINCDPSTIQDMLGSDDKVTNKNILQYMGIIEQKTMEMLQAQQYLNMKRNPPKPEKKEKKGDPTPPTTQQSQKVDLPPVIGIQPPNAGDDDEMSEVIDDLDIRPLTQEELRNAIIRKASKRAANQQLQILTPIRRSRSPRPN